VSVHVPVPVSVPVPVLVLPWNPKGARFAPKGVQI
jgi:hypothetical protein